jgi:hypothetical protein
VRAVSLDDLAGMLIVEAPFRPGRADARARSYRKRPDAEPCWLCGRPLADTRYPLLVSTAYGNELIVGAAVIDSPAYSGDFPIGPDCARRVPAGAIHAR